MKISKETLIDYAKTITKVGANIQQNQKVIITADVEIADFVNIVTEECYRLGAKSVSVIWSNNAQTILKINNENIETLSEVLPWEKAKLKQRVKDKPAQIHLISDGPDDLAGIDQEKYGMMRKNLFNKRYKILKKLDSQYQWTIAAVPSKSWAKKVFPTLSESKAVEALWEQILNISRIPGNWKKNWDTHHNNLKKTGDILNRMNIESLLIKTNLGTNVTIPINPLNNWAGGKESTKSGISYSPNIPTEECFGMPGRKVDGMIYASKPFVFRGELISDAWFKFNNGQLMDYGGSNKDLIKEMVVKPKNASILGEIAIVPNDSPVSTSGVLFYNTLFDENAACHIAFGNSFEMNIRGYEKMSRRKLKKAGMNYSSVHQDIMIGNETTQIIATLRDSKKKITIMNGGLFTKEFLNFDMSKGE